MDSQQQEADGAWKQVAEVVNTVDLGSSTASLNERQDSIKGLLKNHWVQRTCRDAVQAEKAEALERVESALQAKTDLAKAVDYCYQDYTAILRAQVQAAFAALGARTGDLDEVMRRVCGAVGCLLHAEGVEDGVQLPADLKILDPIDLLQYACSELHKQLEEKQPGERGWAAMAVLDVARDFLGSPRQGLPVEGCED